MNRSSGAPSDALISHSSSGAVAAHDGTACPNTRVTPHPGFVQLELIRRWSSGSSSKALRTEITVWKLGAIETAGHAAEDRKVMKRSATCQALTN